MAGKAVQEVPRGMTEDMAEWGWTEAFGEQGCSSCLRGAKGLPSQHLPSTCHPSPQRLRHHQRGRPCVGGSILSVLSSPQAHKVLRHREVQGPVPGRAASAGGCLSPTSHLQGLYPTDHGPRGSVLLDGSWKARPPRPLRELAFHTSQPPSVPRRLLRLSPELHPSPSDQSRRHL